MAQTYYGILTAVGEAKDANAKALGIPLVYAEMAVGDGNGIVPVPDRNRTSLVHQQRRAPLNTLSRDPLNPNQVIAEQVIPESVGGWYIRELGLYDADGDLVAIANCPETYKPLLAEGSGRVQNVRMVIIVSSADNVQLKVDPSIILATRDYADKKVAEVVAAHEAKANPHPQYFRSRDDILPGGLTQQVLRKKSNAANDWEWVDLTAGVTVNVNTKADSQLLAAGQTVVDFTKVTTNGIVLYVGGGRLDEGIDYTINSQTRVTLARAYPKNTRLTAAQNEVAGSVINPLDASKNLADVQNAAIARQNLGIPDAIKGEFLLTANGYQKLASGLIIQWGESVENGTNPGSGTGVNFPIEFPGQLLSLATSAVYASSADYGFVQVYSSSKSGFTWVNNGGSGAAATMTCKWIAVGK
jgi:hypothetical protein